MDGWLIQERKEWKKKWVVNIAQTIWGLILIVLLRNFSSSFLKRMLVMGTETMNVKVVWHFNKPVISRFWGQDISQSTRPTNGGWGWLLFSVSGNTSPTMSLRTTISPVSKLSPRNCNKTKTHRANTDWIRFFLALQTRFFRLFYLISFPLASPGVIFCTWIHSTVNAYLPYLWLNG